MNLIKKPAARLVMRPNPDETDFGLVAVFRGQDVLQGGRVYEIGRSLLDPSEIVIRDVGPSCVPLSFGPGDHLGPGTHSGVCWSNPVAMVIAELPSSALTLKEMEEVQTDPHNNPMLDNDDE
jgi:hypothetical protein